ncbi:hypothetical protein ABPG77_005518 [Micractinium sp. CCAP 211/92]
MQLCVEPAADWLVQPLRACLAAKPVRPLPHVCSFSAFHVLLFSPVATWIGLSALQTPPSAATCNSRELTLLSAGARGHYWGGIIAAMSAAGCAKALLTEIVSIQILATRCTLHRSVAASDLGWQQLPGGGCDAA